MTTNADNTHNTPPADEPLALRLSEGLGAWLPIATAPRDAEVLLWVKVAVGTPLVVQGCWYSDEDIGDAGWIDTNGTSWPVTHWMPLPAPPLSA